MANRPLTPKQAAFIREYVIDNNATQAALRAGYAASCARWAGCTNITKPNIKAELAKRRAEIEAKTEYSIEKWRQQQLSHMKQAAGDNQWGAVAAFARLLGMNIGAFEADNSQKGEKTLIALRNEDKAIAAIIATGKALDEAPDALAE